MKNNDIDCSDMSDADLLDAFDCAFKALRRKYRDIHYIDKNGDTRSLGDLSKDEYKNTIAYLKKNGYKEGRGGVWRK